MNKTLTTWVLLELIVVTGCSSVGPKYQTPIFVPPAAAYKETTDWVHAQPSDDRIHGEWWKIFADPELDALEEQVNVSNQNIAASFAAYQQARAMVREARAQYFPNLSITPNVSTQNGSYTALQGRPSSSSSNFTQYSIPATATWAPDLWGRIRDSVKASMASAQVSAADLENERLLQQGDLAIYFFELHGQDSLEGLYDSTEVNYRKALDLTRALSKTGIDSDEAVAQAEVQLHTAEAQASNLRIARAQYEHAIAVLIGKSASALSIPVKTLETRPPSVPVSVPSKLLERRPDIAASERAVAAANAQIGVAMAAYFPNLNLTGSAGLGSTALGSLFTAPTLVWSLGASFAETIFDGGLRGATVDQFRAAYSASVANYRQTVLTAFRQVEDGISGLKFLSKELGQQVNAVASANRYLKIATHRYRLGIDPYLNVISAQNTALGAQQTEITVRMTQLTTSVQLIEALGGGWDISQLPQDKDF